MTNIKLTDEDLNYILRMKIIAEHEDLLITRECGISYFEAYIALVYEIELDKKGRKNIRHIFKPFFKQIDSWLKKQNFKDSVEKCECLFKMLKPQGKYLNEHNSLKVMEMKFKEKTEIAS